MPENEKKNAFQWTRHISGGKLEFRDVVLDPDGWDRKDLDYSLLEPITKEKFLERLAECTVDMRKFSELLSE